MEVTGDSSIFHTLRKKKKVNKISSVASSPPFFHYYPLAAFSSHLYRVRQQKYMLLTLIFDTVSYFLAALWLQNLAEVGIEYPIHTGFNSNKWFQFLLLFFLGKSSM